MIRVIFKDASTVEFVTVTEGHTDGDKLVLNTADGETLAELALVEVESWNIIL